MMSAVDAGADAILVTCTSVNTVTKTLRDLIPIPVISVEEPVAEEAVAKGRKIGILSSVAEAGKEVEVSIEVADGAFDALNAGDRPLHDDKVRAALAKLADKVDVVVFAQMSMALVDHPSYDIPVLKFGTISYEAAKEAMLKNQK